MAGKILVFDDTTDRNLLVRHLGKGGYERCQETGTVTAITVVIMTALVVDETEIK